MLYYLYILRCRDNTLYTGVTTDITRRLQEHRSASSRSAKYLRGRGPFVQVYEEQWRTRSQALRRESEIKKMRKHAKEALISSG